MKTLTAFLIGVLLMVLAPAAAAQSKDARVRIINRSPTPIFFIYTSPAGSAYYGNVDLLDLQGINFIDSGSSAIVNFNVRDANNKCLQDVQAVGRDGRKWEWTMNVCRETSWTLNP